MHPHITQSTLLLSDHSISSTKVLNDMSDAIHVYDITRQMHPHITQWTLLLSDHSISSTKVLNGMSDAIHTWYHKANASTQYTVNPPTLWPFNLIHRGLIYCVIPNLFLPKTANISFKWNLKHNPIITESFEFDSSLSQALEVSQYLKESLIQHKLYLGSIVQSYQIGFADNGTANFVANAVFFVCLMDYCLL